MIGLNFPLVCMSPSMWPSANGLRTGDFEKPFLMAAEGSPTTSSPRSIMTFHFRRLFNFRAWNGRDWSRKSNHSTHHIPFSMQNTG
jgi:hypothetical protein